MHVVTHSRKLLSRNLTKQENHESYYPRYIGAIRYTE